jgi:DNA-binding IclR family transcriptional regulator
MTDVSQYLGVASSSAHRLLSMLQFRGFLRQDPETRTYTAGPALDDLVFGELGRQDVRIRALPILERVSSDLHETVHLGRLEGIEVHFIAAVESTRALRVGSRLGRSMPAHCTSTGKAMLATLSDEEVIARYPDESLQPLTRHSLTRRSDLLAALAEIRRRGYASSSEESEEGVSSVAVTIPVDRRPRLAINASVPRSRMTSGTEKAIRSRLVSGADEIAALIV